MSEAKSQLATFRIDADKWDAFKRKARQSGASASEMLIGFIDSYLGDGGVPAPLPDASEIEDIKAKLERLDEIEARLDKLEKQQPGKSTPSSRRGVETDSLSQSELDPIRDRVLLRLKLGKQAPGYKAAVKALNMMISELSSQD